MNATLVMGFADVVVLSPLVETGLLVIPIRLLSRVGLHREWIPVLSGIFWAGLHASYTGTLWGVVAAWPFYLFTWMLMRFEKPSLDRGWLIASSVHALHNLVALVASAYLAIS